MASVPSGTRLAHRLAHTAVFNLGARLPGRLSSWPVPPLRPTNARSPVRSVWRYWSRYRCCWPSSLADQRGPDIPLRTDSRHRTSRPYGDYDPHTDRHCALAVPMLPASASISKPKEPSEPPSYRPEFDDDDHRALDDTGRIHAVLRGAIAFPVRRSFDGRLDLTPGRTDL